jgi:hypothetical protein
MKSFGAAAGAGYGIPTRSGGGVGRGRAWGGLGVHLARLGALVGGMALPATVPGSDGRDQPRWPAVRRWSSVPGTTRGCASLGRCQRSH